MQKKKNPRALVLKVGSSGSLLDLQIQRLLPPTSTESEALRVGPSTLLHFWQALQVSLLHKKAGELPCQRAVWAEPGCFFETSPHRNQSWFQVGPCSEPPTLGTPCLCQGTYWLYSVLLLRLRKFKDQTFNLRRSSAFTLKWTKGKKITQIIYIFKRGALEGPALSKSDYM